MKRGLANGKVVFKKSPKMQPRVRVKAMEDRLRSSNLCLVRVLEETWGDCEESTFEKILTEKMHFEYWAG